MICKHIGIICLLCLLITTGCAGKMAAAQPSALIPAAGAAGLSEPLEAVSPAARSDLKADSSASNAVDDIANIFPAGNDAILIDGDSLYLYSLSQGKVLAKTGKGPFVQPRYQPCGRGYAAIGDIQNSMNGKIVFYDGALQKEGELAFSQITGSNEALFSDSFAISPDGKKIAYADMNGISVFDVASKTRKPILALGQDAPAEASEIMHIAQLLFTGDGQSLVFLSGVNSGGQSVSACGKIGIDGAGLVNKTTAGFVPAEIAGSYGGYAFFGEDDRYRTGRVAVLNIADGSIGFLPLATKQERVTFGSDTGRYYATGALSETDCTVRIYETATGKKVFEKAIPHGGNPLYVARTPVIRVLDGRKACIVLMGNRIEDLKTMVTYLQF